MFTGIIQGKAKIVSIDKKKNFRTHVIDFPNDMLNGLKTGASISYNGCCLTVTQINKNCISVDLIEETLRVTNLGKLQLADTVNIERAVKLGDEIGGHLVSGHISSTAEIKEIKTSDNNYQIWLKMKDLSLLKYIFYKGFIAIDGISLTVGKVTAKCFCVYLIPETLQCTSLGEKKLGQHVNVEVDFQTQAIVDTVEKTLALKLLNTNK